MRRAILIGLAAFVAFHWGVGVLLHLLGVLVALLLVGGSLFFIWWCDVCPHCGRRTTNKYVWSDCPACTHDRRRH